MTLPSAVRHSSSTGFWNTMPISVRGASTVSPSAMTTPLEGAIRPAAIINSVLLPQPLGPTIEMNSPRRPLSET